MLFIVPVILTVIGRYLIRSYHAMESDRNVNVRFRGPEAP